MLPARWQSQIDGVVAGLALDSCTVRERQLETSSTNCCWLEYLPTKFRGSRVTRKPTQGPKCSLGNTRAAGR